MAVRTKAAFLSQYNTVFADNTTREISEADLRDFRLDINDSFLNITDQAFNGVKGWNHEVNTIANLKTVLTASLTLKSYISFRDTGNSDALRTYELVSGTDAESSPTIIRPTDYATTTNEKVWKLAVVGSSGGTAATTTFTPAGSIVATNVQTAIQELDSEKEAVGVAAGLIATEVTDRNAAIVSAVEGLKWKDSVKVATTTAGTLATSFENGDTIDGVVLATGNRILIKDQATQSENGIYIVAASGAPTRSTDANSATELEGATVPVQQGTSNANTSWTQTTDGITLGSSNLVFAQIGSSAPSASESTAGIIEIATQAETHTGSDDTRSITPLKLATEKEATGGLVGLTLFKINFKNVANTFISFFTNSNTAARTYTFPDRDGTIADNTDLALKAPLASPTFTGTVTVPTPTTATGASTKLYTDNTAFINAIIFG